MNILHICTSSRGGAAQAAIRLHKGLLQKGVDSNFLFLYNLNKNIESSHEFKIESLSLTQRILLKVKAKKTLNSIHWEKLHGRVKGFEVFTFPESNFDITEDKSYKKADVINLHWVSNFIDFPSFFSKNKKPLIWTLHDMNAFTGGCHYSSGSGGYLESCKNCIQLEGTYSKSTAFENLNVKKKSLEKHGSIEVVCPSNWLLNESSSSSLFNKYTHHHIPYGLDTSIFKPLNKDYARKVFNLPLDKKILLFVSERVENTRKGFALLIASIKEIKEKNPDVVVCSIGHFSKEEESLEAINLGPISDERLMAVAYCAADVFMLPSLEDNLPNVMLESLACGTPIVGFKNGGIPDLVKNNQTGWVVESRDLLQFSEKTLCLINDDVERKRMGENGRRLIEESYTLKAQAEKYENLYKKVSGT